MRDVSELAQARSDLGQAKRREEELSRWALVDSLTALANRRGFEERIKDALARGKRSRRPVILLLIDLDRFKEVNDSFGHAAGDTVLWEFARRLEQCTRTTDFVARLGGDEFVIVLEGASGIEDAQLVAGTVQSRMKVPFSLREGTLTQITASIGIAVSGIDEANSSALLGKADEALYRAKNAGRNTVAVSRG
jgi:diguanylate cyclase (GGDEF)-like protein